MQSNRFAVQLRRSRIALFSILLPALPIAFTLAGATESTLRLVYILLGFSLIIFLHELGHFVVARMCSVKCLAFSLGIGPRMLGWRKGGHLTFGNDPYDPETISKKNDLHKLEHAEAAVTHSDLPTTAEVPPHPKNVGDTDYRVSWFPLGGYVRMLGQDDMDPTKISDDPNSFNRRPIWQRMCIVSAGVTMNLIFAAVCFSIIFSPHIGVEFPAAVVGPVQHDSPADKAGLKMGDRVVSIDREKPRGQLEFTDLMMTAALSSGSDPIHLEVQPYGAPAGTTKSFDIIPKRSETTKFLAFGFEPLPSTKIGGQGSDYLNGPDDKPDPKRDELLRYDLNKEGLSQIKSGDQIVAVDGQKVGDDYITYYQHIQEGNGKPVVLSLVNLKDKSIAPHTITLYPHLERVSGVDDYPTVLGLSPRVIVAGDPSSGYPAKQAGIKENDVILRVGDRSNPSKSQFIEIVSGSNGQPLDITIERDGTSQTFPAVTPKLVKDRYLVGLPIDQDIHSLAFAPVQPDSEAGALDLPPKATIAAIDGEKVTTWNDVYSVLRTKTYGTKIPVTFNAGGTQVTHSLTLSKDESDAIHAQLHYLLGIRLENQTFNQHGKNAGEAVLMGMDHTKKFILQVYMTLAGLFRGTVEASNLHGIVGITKIGYDVQERGPVWLWYILAMVSVNLAVANFLPLPIVDGGLFLLLILEKIRGKPLSLKVQSAIQVVGIVLLAGLFLFVTWNDIGLFTK